MTSVIPNKPTWRLPTIVMAAAGLVYLVTLNFQANLLNEGLAARACGWQWTPMLQQPLAFLFQLPFHLLPVAWRPAALNLGNGLLAVSVLGLLARCVMIWPADRTPDMRRWQLESLYFLPVGALSWLPAVWAAASLALTMNFWEHATSASGDMIDVLILAVVTWCLLEFRFSRNRKWLGWMAFIYGTGMVNDWAFIVLFPCLVVALISMHGWKSLVVQLARTLSPFFLRKKSATQTHAPRIRRPNWRAESLIIGGLAAGGLLYLLLPLVYLLTGDGVFTFWQCLKELLRSQKHGLSAMSHILLSDGRGVLLAFSSLVPIFLISIRWRDEATPDHVQITNVVLRSIYGMVAIVCAGVLLGAAIGPSQLVKGQPFLLHYFLCALSFGCCLHYLLRLLLGRPAMLLRRRRTTGERLLRAAGVSALLLLAVVLLSLMAWRNGSQIWLANRTLPADFKRWVLADLPPGPKVLMADDPILLNLGRLLLLGTPASQETIFIDTSSGLWSDYHRYQLENYPTRWQTNFQNAPRNSRMQPYVLDRLLMDLAATRTIVYLEPTTINPLDHFQRQGGDFHYTLQLYSTNVAVAAMESPVKPPGFNHPSWTELAHRIPRLTNAVESFQPSTEGRPPSKLSRLLKLPANHNLTVAYFAEYYSRALDERAVELQAIGRWPEAADALTNALKLNPNNIVAQENLAFNQRRQLKADEPPDNSADNPADLGNFRTLEAAVGICGPYDEPYHRIKLGDDFAKNKEPFHAIDQFERVLALQPQNWGARLWLIRLNMNAGRPAVALQMIDPTRKILTADGRLGSFQVDLDVIEAQANLALGQKAQGMAALNHALADAHDDPRLVAGAVQTLWRAGMKDEARNLLDQLLKQHPNVASTYILRGLVYLELEQYDEAEKDFSQALVLDPKNVMARFKRGFTRMQKQDYPAAREDFQAMLQNSTNAFPAHYALAQVAKAQNDLPTAKQELEIYLSQAPSDALDYTNAVEQLKAMP